MKINPVIERYGMLWPRGPLVEVIVEMSPYGNQTMVATARIVTSDGAGRVLLSSVMGRDLSAPIDQLDEDTVRWERGEFSWAAREYIVNRFRNVDLMFNLVEAGLA